MTITGWLALPLLLLAPYFDASVITSPLGTQSTMTVEDDDDDLVITGQKLRTVRIRYQRSGRRVTSCEATQSSGKAEIDRLMCAFVRGCVTVGFTSRRAAMTCVNERIDQLATDSQDTIQSVLQAEDISKPTDLETDDIVVIGTRLVIPPGRWLFMQTGYYKSSHSDTTLPSRRWKMCIKDGEAGRVLNHILRAGSTSLSIPTLQPPAECRRWRIGIGAKGVTGSLSCFMGKSRMTGQLTGYVGDDTLQLTKTYNTQGQGFRASGWSDITGTRSGRCDEN